MKIQGTALSPRPTRPFPLLSTPAETPPPGGPVERLSLSCEALRAGAPKPEPEGPYRKMLAKVGGVLAVTAGSAAVGAGLLACGQLAAVAGMPMEPTLSLLNVAVGGAVMAGGDIAMTALTNVLWPPRPPVPFEFGPAVRQARLALSSLATRCLVLPAGAAGMGLSVAMAAQGPAGTAFAISAGGVAGLATLFLGSNVIKVALAEPIGSAPG